MKKLIALGMTLALAATLVGCGKKNEGSSDGDGGNSREKIVKNFCEAFRSCDSGVLFEIGLFMKDEIKFADGGTREKNFLAPLVEMAKSKEPVKTKVLKSATIKKVSASIIEATCNDSDLDVNTLYFFVGHKKTKDGKEGGDKIMGITADKKFVDEAIKEAEELERGKDKKEAVGDGERPESPNRRYYATTNMVSTARMTNKVPARATSRRYYEAAK